MAIIGILLCVVAVGIVSGADDPMQEFVEGNMNMTANVIKFESPDQHNKGIICPLCAQLSFALVADGANGDTHDQLQEGSNLPNKEKTKEAVKKLLPLLAKSDDDLILTLVHKLYLDNKFKVKKEFKDVAKSVFQCEVQNVNFSDNHGTSEIINAWVINKTADKFQNFMSPERFNDETALFFINALYLKGKWETPFPPKNTNKEQFYFLRKDPGDVQMMHNSGKYLYFHCGFLQAKFLEIPLKGKSVTFTFVLPDAKDGLKNLENDIILYLEPHNLTLKEVDVSLPKFSASTYHDFTEFLKNMKADKVLSEEADLSGISEEKTHLKAAPQRAYINIYEDGVDAAFATATIIERSRKTRAAEPGLTFNADHPFFYIVREVKSQVILFVGRFQ